VVGQFYSDTSNPSLGHTAAYTYDPTNRLTHSVATGSATHNLTFAYDRFGNMTCVQNQQTNGVCPQFSIRSATNQVTTAGYTYDAAGNLTGDGTHTYQWDAEG
jgi:YD repeat-containing protein